MADGPPPANPRQHTCPAGQFASLVHANAVPPPGQPCPAGTQDSLNAAPAVPKQHWLVAALHMTVPHGIVPTPAPLDEPTPPPLEEPMAGPLLDEPTPPEELAAAPLDEVPTGPPVDDPLPPTPPPDVPPG